MKSVQKVCPKCTDQTYGRPTPHTVKDGKWKCGLCGHETPKKTYNTKKNKDMEDLIKSLGEDAPVNAVGGGNIAGMGVDKPGKPGSGEPGVYKKKKKDLVIVPMQKRKSFLDFIKGK